MKKQKKPWIRGCLIASAALFLLAGLFYAYHYMSLDREFHGVSDFYGEHYSEIFSFQSGDEPAEFLEQVKAAFAFVGTAEEAEAELGLLSRYACTQGIRQEFGYECITYSMEGDTGYVWVASWDKSYDAEGTLTSGSGSENRRILTRWELKDGEIVGCMEHP